MEIGYKCLRLYKSIQDYSNSNLYFCNTLLSLKKVVKKGIMEMKVWV